MFQKSTIVVILGGGRGGRLYPLTKMRSKPAVPIGGKYRLIDIPISNALHSSLDEIFVLTQFNSASLNHHIARTYSFDSFSEGFVEVLAAEQTMSSQEWFQGTADAVRKIYPHLDREKWKYVLILSGDHIYRMNYQDFLTDHIHNNADLSVCVLGVSEKNASSFGLMKIDARTRIVEFQEKPSGPDLEKFRVDTTFLGYSQQEAEEKPFLGSMGIYIFNRPVLEKVLFQDKGLHDFGKQIIPKCIEQKLNVSAYLFNGFWEDVGTIRSFFEMNLSLCQMNPPFQLFHPTHPIFTRQRHLSGTVLGQGHVENCIVNDGCIIRGADLKNSVVGLRTFIDEGARIEGCLLMGNDYYDSSDVSESKCIGIGKNVRISNAIIDKNSRIGHGAIIENQKKIKEYDDPEGRFYIRDGIVIVVKGARIPDGMVI